MSLDQNLFTLFLATNSSYPAGTVVDLTDGSGTIHYRKRRIISQNQPVYRIEVSDPLSEALLASASAPSATSKHKTLELYNPSNTVELKYSGTLTFRWSFKWETHEFEWKREECFIIRKPDPPVLVAVTKEPPGRIRTASVQILDYNLNRFDIEDRKGLEIVILTALMTFQDSNDVYHEPNAIATTTPATTTPASNTPLTTAAPALPPKPAPKKGVQRIAELQLGRGQVNEVTVLEEGAITDYAKHCAQLLQDEAMLFISVRSSDPNQVPKVLHVVEETKRLRYKASDPDLHQYVLYDTKEGVAPQKGPRIINLDDNGGKGKNKAYTPPKSLTVHLSKIDMPELRPRGAPLDGQQTREYNRDNGKTKEKDQSKRVEKGKAKERDKDKDKGKDKDKRKDKDKDKDSRLKRTSPPIKQSTSPPHPTVLRMHRSQYFHPTSALSPSGPGPSLSTFPSPSYPAPPLPFRTHAPQHSSGSLRRQSMYGSLNAEHYEVRHGTNVTGSANNSTQTSGLLGRFLGR